MAAILLVGPTGLERDHLLHLLVRAEYQVL
jgi:hypothetical protein